MLQDNAIKYLSIIFTNSASLISLIELRIHVSSPQVHPRFLIPGKSLGFNIQIWWKRAQINQIDLLNVKTLTLNLLTTYIFYIAFANINAYAPTKPKKRKEEEEEEEYEELASAGRI